MSFVNRIVPRALKRALQAKIDAAIADAQARWAEELEARLAIQVADIAVLRSQCSSTEAQLSVATRELDAAKARLTHFEQGSGTQGRDLRNRLEERMDQLVRDQVMPAIRVRVEEALRRVPQPGTSQAEVLDAIRAELDNFAKGRLESILNSRKPPSVLEKACTIAPWGDYLEFGVFRGVSLSAAYNAYRRRLDRALSGSMDHVTQEPDSINTTNSNGGRGCASLASTRSKGFQNKSA